MSSNKSTRRDYRFDMLSYGLRKENPRVYAFSRQASEDLGINDCTGMDEYTPEMWEEFWEDLNRDYLESL